MCAGFSLALSTFRPDGSLRPFAPTARRLGFILVCAYLLHAPGSDPGRLDRPGHRPEVPGKYSRSTCSSASSSPCWSCRAWPGCSAGPWSFAAAALGAAVAVALVSPRLWRPGTADGWWLPVRGLVNGNPDRGVTALFPLAPWFAFAASGAVLGALYRQARALPGTGPAPAPGGARPSG